MEGWPAELGRRLDDLDNAYVNRALHYCRATAQRRMAAGIFAALALTLDIRLDELK